MFGKRARILHSVGDDEVVRPAVLHSTRTPPPASEVRVGVEETLIIPEDDDEEGWLRWAQIALKYDGPEKAIQILNAYLALNPVRAGALAEEWSNHESPSDGIT